MDDEDSRLKSESQEISRVDGRQRRCARRPSDGGIHGLSSSGASATSEVVVVGAGAFGGWTALYLREIGLSVTLVDAHGPGNARSSSGGET